MTIKSLLEVHLLAFFQSFQLHLKMTNSKPLLSSWSLLSSAFLLAFYSITVCTAFWISTVYIKLWCYVMLEIKLISLIWMQSFLCYSLILSFFISRYPSRSLSLFPSTCFYAHSQFVYKKRFLCFAEVSVLMKAKCGKSAMKTDLVTKSCHVT